jgi:hypothetical protein
MAEKKIDRKNGNEHKANPAFYNDQLGENAGEGRLMKKQDEKEQNKKKH